MSKPLELTIYPPVSRFTREVIDFNIAQGLAPYFGISAEMHAPGLVAMQAKRLTEAELCAEYWRHEGDYRMLTDGYQIESFGTTIPQAPWVTEDLERDRVNTLHRFATHPHYFEATEPESDTE